MRAPTINGPTGHEPRSKMPAWGYNLGINLATSCHKNVRRRKLQHLQLFHLQECILAATNIDKS